MSSQTSLHRGFVLNCGVLANVPCTPLHTLHWNKYFTVSLVFSTADIPRQVCQSDVFSFQKIIQDSLMGINFSHLLQGGYITKVQKTALTISAQLQQDCKGHKCRTEQNTFAIR